MSLRGYLINTTRPSTRRRSAIAAVATGSLLTAGVPVALLTAAPADAAQPALRLRVASSAVTVERWGDNPEVYLDLGTHLVAGSSPFELRVKRSSYSKPIVATQVIRRNGKTTTRTLPKGLVKSFEGLDRFLHVTLTDSAGKKVVDRYDTVCPGGTGGRVDPKAPDTNPYPEMCSTTPFAFGTVWGIQRGWSAETSFYGQGAAPVTIPDGTYTAKISVTKAYRDLFGIPGGEQKVKVTVRTRAEDGGGTGGLQSRRESTPAAAPRPAAKKPAGAGKVPAGPKPDLRSLPAHWVQIIQPDEGQDPHPGAASRRAAAAPSRDYLAFAATVWNSGPSPLVVDGFRRPGKDVMDAYQYFYDTKGKQTGYARTGTMEWDPKDGHQHWHFTDFASYRLLKADKKEVVRSQKEAFCLANTDAVDLLTKNANWKPSNTDLHTSCGRQSSVSVREVLDVGSGDTYMQYLPGQSFDVTGLPNGTYYIQVLANPDRKLHEANTKNNQSLRKVILGGTPGARTVKVPAVGLVNAP